MKSEITKVTSEQIRNNDCVARSSAMMKSKTAAVVAEHIGRTGDGNNKPIPDSYVSRNSPPSSVQSSQSQQQQQTNPNNSNNIPLRRGKWTPEEESYALAAIRDFNSGYLDAPPGSTLRTYLSMKLRCDPMRITKKFTGNASIGKKVFHPALREDPKILKEVEDSQAKLESVYQKWRQRLESQEQEMARKSMAAAAVSAASLLCDNNPIAQHSLFSTVMMPQSSTSSHLLRGVGYNMQMMAPEMMNTTTAFGSKNKVNTIQISDKAKHGIANTATWLEQAEMLLSNDTLESNKRQEEIEEEMKEISRLITGSQAILAISANLPKILDNDRCNNDGLRSSSMPKAQHKLQSCPNLRTLCTDAEMVHSEQSISTSTAGKRKRSLSYDKNVKVSPNDPMKMLASLSSQAVPVPVDYSNDVKRSSGVVGSSTKDSTKAVPNNGVDAEDATTFVNFLQSVVHVKK